MTICQASWDLMFEEPLNKLKFWGFCQLFFNYLTLKLPSSLITYLVDSALIL